MINRRCVIGVDLGGTNVRAMAIYEDGKAAGEMFEQSSHAREGVDATTKAIVSVIKKAISSAAVSPTAIGMAIPGFADDRVGLVRWAPHLGSTVDGVYKYWVDVPIKELLSHSVKLPICIGNDVNLAALGEYMFGCGEGHANCLVMLALGTGVGGGVVMSSHAVHGDVSGPLLLLGGNRGGIELGQMCIQRGGIENLSGFYGTLEAYCQRDSIVRRALYKLEHGRPSLINDLLNRDWSRLTPEIISDAAHQGDELAIEVWEEVGTYLGVGIGNYINIFAPDIFVIGGQISKAGKFLLEPAIKKARNVAISALFTDAKIMLSKHSDEMGMLGGAALALQNY